jgi:sodium pump decarboxylase gamma subunit
METDLLTLFSDPSKIESLTAAQKLWAALITTILGMGITFVVLVTLQFVLGFFGKLSGEEKKPPPAPKPAPAPAAKKADEAPVSQGDDELVPVIAASIAMMLETSVSNIQIRDIRRVADTSPSWSRAGIAEQMQTRI